MSLFVDTRHWSVVTPSQGNLLLETEDLSANFKICIHSWGRHFLVDNQLKNWISKSRCCLVETLVESDALQKSVPVFIRKGTPRLFRA